MFQGTGSDVGKSLLVAGLARAYTRRGEKVRPFKPQNMSNNAAVTPGGGEIGRAQALQARACYTPLSVHMNPVLLKPQSDIGAQVVVQGKTLGAAEAQTYQRLKAQLLPRVLESFYTLCHEADLVLIEGAGSASEINLRAGDIANMGFALAAQVPVALIGDIDRGGIIASICGTHRLLPEGERKLLSGYIINKFRGDSTLFAGGIEVITQHTDLPCLGMIPWFERAHVLPAEDALALDRDCARQPKAISIAVPVFPHIANFDDLDPLIAEHDVEVQFIRRGNPLPGDADLVILPGSKSTLADLKAVRDEGWDIDIYAHVRRGGALLGLCGGYQMLGESIHDPLHIEGPIDSLNGLGLLPIDTVITSQKRLTACHGRELISRERISGYEMHMGNTTGAGLHQPMLELNGVAHGALNQEGRIMGCYVHGIFSSDRFRHAFLSRLAPRNDTGLRYEHLIEETLDALAEHLETHMDLNALRALARPVIRT